MEEYVLTFIEIEWDELKGKCIAQKEICKINAGISPNNDDIISIRGKRYSVYTSLMSGNTLNDGVPVKPVRLDVYVMSIKE